MDGAFLARIVLGAHNILEDEESQVEVFCKIGDFAIHEEYDGGFKNDIAYIRFPRPITFSKQEFVKCQFTAFGIQSKSQPPNFPTLFLLVIGQ